MLFDDSCKTNADKNNPWRIADVRKKIHFNLYFYEKLSRDSPVLLQIILRKVKHINTALMENTQMTEILDLNSILNLWFDVEGS